MTTYLLPLSKRRLVSSSISFFISQKYNYKMSMLSVTQCKRKPDVTIMSKRNAISMPNLLKKLVTKQKIQLSGSLLYESIADKIDYNRFFQDFEMEDTFFSWFLITEIHVWMMALRIMQEEEYAEILRNFLIEAMWNDVKIRTKKLGFVNVSLMNKQLELLSEQFNASLIGYDEGILSNDALLANHIWKRFFKCQTNDPIQLERLVEYIRKQVNLLLKISSADLFSLPPTISWVKC